MPRLAILVSGRGSNLQSLIDAKSAGDLPAELVGVISNRPRAFALERARLAGIPTQVINHKRYADRQQFEQALLGQLREWATDYVVLAGFMRVLTAQFISRWSSSSSTSCGTSG